MSSKKKSHKSLKALSRKMASEDELFSNLLDLLEHENPIADRAAALVVSSLIEQGLERLLDSHFVPLLPQEYDEIFGGLGILASTAAKIRLGYAMNLYELEVREDLDTVRLIRNAFAHAQEPISFETEEIATMCKHLKTRASFEDFVRAKHPLTSRRVYGLCVFGLCELLAAASKPMNVDEAVAELKRRHGSP